MLKLAPLAALALLAAVPATAIAGPPWIGIELPVNPMDPTTRDAFLVVHTYHHAEVMLGGLTGHAIGMVNGKRQTIELAFTRTSVNGEYALRRNWPEHGAWVLQITTGEGEGAVTALVGVGADGEVHSVNVPRRSGDERWGRPVTDQDINAALQSVAALPSSGAHGTAALAVALPLLVGWGITRRRR